MCGYTSKHEFYKVGDCAVKRMKSFHILVIYCTIFPNKPLSVSESTRKEGFVTHATCAVQVQLCTLVFQAAREQLMPPDVQATLRLAVEKCESWQAYRIARQALRYGQFSFAELIFSDLAYKVSQNYVYFLTSVCWGVHAYAYALVHLSLSLSEHALSPYLDFP